MVSASAWVGLTLPGMIELPGSFSGQAEFAEARPRGPLPNRRKIVGDLGQADGQHVQRAPTARPSCRGSPEPRTCFGAVTNGMPVSVASSAAIASAKPARVLSPVPTAGPALRELVQPRQHRLDLARDAGLDLRGIARHLLPQTDRRGVLQMGASRS